MNMHNNQVYEYKAGGALPVGAPTYVKRRADDELFESLLAGEFCYVLNTRQMGKSSLRVRTMARLRQCEVVCAEVDLSIVASAEATKKQWYDAIIKRIAAGLGLSNRFDFREWSAERDDMSPSDRFGEFLETVVLDKCRGKIVIFFDEIDSTLNLNFNSDEFFTIIRACFNRRADEPELERLTFALLGVADPADLIKDKTRTPFNIGRAIELRGFTLTEAQPLAAGLTKAGSSGTEALRAILEWTNGQPFLTQKICMMVDSAEGMIRAGEERAQIARIVQERIIDNWDAHDDPEHLKTIANRILMSPNQRTSRLLGMYQQLLKDGVLQADNSPEQMELRLSGLVVNENGLLKVYNPIYAAIFDAQWVESNLARLRPYSESLLAWYASKCTDESRLLRGQALRDAQSWSEGKSLSNADWHFLNASQNLERREIENAYAAEREALRIQREAQAKLEAALQTEATAKANAEEALLKEQKAAQILKDANEEAARKASRSRTVFLIAAVAAVMLAGAAVAFGFKASRLQLQASAAEQRVNAADQKVRSAEERALSVQAQITENEKKLNEQKTAYDNESQQHRADLKQGEQNLRKVQAKAQSDQKKANDTIDSIKAQIGDLNARYEDVQQKNKDLTERLKKCCPPD